MPRKFNIVNDKNLRPNFIYRNGNDQLPKRHFYVASSVTCMLITMYEQGGLHYKVIPNDCSDEAEAVRKRVVQFVKKTAQSSRVEIIRARSQVRTDNILVTVTAFKSGQDILDTFSIELGPRGEVLLNPN